MFSVRQKREIADAVQAILRATNHPELPDGEIVFKLHVEGAEPWSFADIRNNGAIVVPMVNPWNEAQDTQRTDPPNCDWHRDEFGNWFSGCSETMPDFTPWKGTDPKGSFCPKCGKIITVRVHDKP